MKAVIYARYSSDSQREESIEGQLRECTEYAERNGITILRSYIDRALSARTADRPEFQNMIKDSEQKLFDVVLIWKLDRFSRDRYDSAHYKRILKKNGVKVVSVKENISDGPEGIILESMLEGYAEYYSAELSEKIQRGQKENALKCKNNGGNTPLGYVVGADGVLAVDPLTAPLVTEIFTLYDSGESISEITASLNGRGLKTKKGKAFKIGGVSLILKNRKYIGEYQYGSVIIPKGIPAIIDDDLFDRVQRRMAFNKKAPAKAKATEEYLLTTKLFCGTCERLMAGESGTSSTKGVKHYYYKCGGAKRKLGCKRKSVRKHWIERAAVLVTVQRVLRDEEISRIAEAIVALQEKEDTSLPAMRQQLTECEKAIDNMLNAIQMGVLTASTKERLEKLEMQREELKLSILQAQMARPRYTKEQVVSWISRFKYGNVDDPQYQKQIIDTFINSIYVFDDKLAFTYNFKDGTEAITLAEIQAAFGSDLTQVAPPKARLTVSVSLLLCGGVSFAGQDGRGTVSPGVTTVSEVLCMNRILFVCHGNICRSPMAEAVMRHLVKEAGAARSYFIDSAATSREELGNPIYPPAKRALAAHGIPSGDHTARQMTRADYDGFDLLIGMDHRNLANMRRIAGSDPESKICLLLAYAGRPEDEVADPWYTGDFEATFRDVRAGCLGLLAALGTD